MIIIYRLNNLNRKNMIEYYKIELNKDSIMDKQIVTVLFSFILYVIYVLLPMVPALVIYKLFPDTTITTTGTLSGWKVKTTGAFAGYIITVVLGYFLVQNTHQLIAQMNSPYWDISAKVELLNEDGTPYRIKRSKNNSLIDTLQVQIDPKLQRVNSGTVHLIIPGHRAEWEKRDLKFEIPNYGYTLINLKNASKNAIIDNYSLSMELLKPIKIVVDKDVVSGYKLDNSEPLVPSSSGPAFNN